MTGTERTPAPTFEAISAKSLSLRARTLVRGLQVGRHRGSGRGVSSEFASHRPYTPGDEPRRLDWKLFARTRKHFFKQTREDSSVRCVILLDSSGSMGIGSKWTTAATLAAAIARVALKQADATGLTLFAEKTVEEGLPNAERIQFRDTESDRILTGSPTELDAPYRLAVAENHRLVRAACLRHGATVVTIRCGQSNLTAALRLTLAGLSERSG